MGWGLTVYVDGAGIYPSYMFEVRVLNVSRGTVLAEEAVVAETPQARRRGLLGTDFLGDGAGMLILPCRQVHTFGMRYPIDVIFIEDSWKVKRITHRMRPNRLSALVLASRAVLELPAARAAETGTREGDILRAQLLRNGFLPDL